MSHFFFKYIASLEGHESKIIWTAQIALDSFKKRKRTKIWVGRERVMDLGGVKINTNKSYYTKFSKS